MNKTKIIQIIGFSFFLTAIAIFISCMMIFANAGIELTVVTVMMVEFGGQILFITSKQNQEAKEKRQ
jgi:uncharacterized membrane protein